IYLYMHDPRDPHFTALNRILCYVRGALGYGLQLHVSSTTQLNAYSDADWAGCPVTRRSTSGYCVFLRDNLLSWSMKRQVTLSRSSVETEYRGVANVVAETAWIRNLLCELHTNLFTATLIYCDNVSAVYMSANPVQHQRTKHIEIDIHLRGSNSRVYELSLLSCLSIMSCHSYLDVSIMSCHSYLGLKPIPFVSINTLYIVENKSSKSITLSMKVLPILIQKNMALIPLDRNV
nr:ribonuclease H-like domain-containing protein [Tanacetum cinerariifolium]